MSDSSKKALQIPIMYAFREAFAARDAKKGGMEYKDGERVLSDRGRARRKGANEEELKRDLGVDLMQLANTVNLAAAANLDGLDYVQRSVLNFGVLDLSVLADKGKRLALLPKQLKAALLNNEPRFVEETMEIVLAEEVNATDQTFRFEVFAEMACRPVDIPMEFVAEIDVASGRLRFSDPGKNG